jgi:hypothetical protein
MHNRHLVPMPKPRPHRQPRSRPAPTAVIAPSGLQTWHCFAFLIVAAIVWYFMKWPLIVVAMIGVPFAGFVWLSHRFPRTMLVIAVFLFSLFRR